jgi:hypothetical protein
MLECVLRVNVMAQANWEEYMPEEVTNMKGTSHAISLSGDPEWLYLATKHFLMWVATA